MKPPVPEKEVVECFNMCKAAMERRGLNRQVKIRNKWPDRKKIANKRFIADLCEEGSRQ